MGFWSSLFSPDPQPEETLDSFRFPGFFDLLWNAEKSLDSHLKDFMETGNYHRTRLSDGDKYLEGIGFRGYLLNSHYGCRSSCLEAFNAASPWLQESVGRSRVSDFLNEHMCNEIDLWTCQRRTAAFINAIEVKTTHRELKTMYMEKADEFIRKVFPPAKFNAFLRRTVGQCWGAWSADRALEELKSTLELHRWGTKAERENTPAAIAAREQARIAREEAEKEYERAREEAERREREEMDRLQKEVELRVQQQQQEEEAARRREEEQARERQRQIEAAEKVWRCKKDGFMYPASLPPTCPQCGSTDDQQLLAILQDA